MAGLTQDLDSFHSCTRMYLWRSHGTDWRWRACGSLRGDFMAPAGMPRFTEHTDAKTNELLCKFKEM
jgi:hypothetical protein